MRWFRFKRLQACRTHVTACSTYGCVAWRQASYLEQRGLEIIDRKWRCVFGEADIVARDQGELVLVEVKTRLARSKEDDLAPEVAVGQRKLNRYERMALMYYAEQASSGSIRFDVIALKQLNDHNVMLRHFLSAYAWDR